MPEQPVRPATEAQVSLREASSSDGTPSTLPDERYRGAHAATLDRFDGNGTSVGSSIGGNLGRRSGGAIDLFPLRPRRHRNLYLPAQRPRHPTTHRSRRVLRALGIKRRTAHRLSASAEIWIYDPETDTSERIDVDLRSPRIGRNRRFVDAARYLHSWSVHTDGHAVALAARERSSRCRSEQAVRQYGQRDGVRYRIPHWTNDGEALFACSDEKGEEAIEVYSTADGPAPSGSTASMSGDRSNSSVPVARDRSHQPPQRAD